MVGIEGLFITLELGLFEGKTIDKADLESYFGYYYDVFGVDWAEALEAVADKDLIQRVGVERIKEWFLEVYQAGKKADEDCIEEWSHRPEFKDERNDTTPPDLDKKYNNIVAKFIDESIRRLVFVKSGG